MKKNEEELRKLGQSVYETVLEMFDDKGFHYEKHDDDFVITCTVTGEDIPMEILFAVRYERQIVQLVSPMPFTIPEDKRTEIALAITAVNDMLLDGNFDLDLAKGRISFRLAESYIESILGKELFEYMLMVSASTIDDFNDKFMMISKGMLSIDQFIESLN